MRQIFLKPAAIFIALAVVSCALLGACAFLYLKYRKSQSRVAEAELIIGKMRQEQASLAEEKSKAEKDNQKLQADALSYLGINTKLQEDKDAVLKQLDEAKNVLKRQEGEVQRVKLEFDELFKKTQEDKDSGRKDAQAQSLEALKKRLAGLEGTLRKERALYHYNLGVAYAKAKFFKEAEAAYEKSLEFEPGNAEAHYNLGLLYDNYEYDPFRARTHFSKYLELKPEALDKDEVQGWIKALSDRVE